MGRVAALYAADPTNINVFVLQGEKARVVVVVETMETDGGKVTLVRGLEFNI